MPILKVAKLVASLIKWKKGFIRHSCDSLYSFFHDKGNTIYNNRGSRLEYFHSKSIQKDYKKIFLQQPKYPLFKYLDKEKNHILILQRNVKR